MIKTFEQFINEKYNINVYSLYTIDMYGAPLFNEISESIANTIYNSINEGHLIIDSYSINEGIFDAIANIFKKTSKNVDDKINDEDIKKEEEKPFLRKIKDMSEKDGDIKTIGGDLKFLEKNKKNYDNIIELCTTTEELCEKIAEKENSKYISIGEKLTAINEAIKEFTENAINQIQKIISTSYNGLTDVAGGVVLFCRRMAEFAKKYMEKIGEGSVIGFILPFIFTYSICEGAMKLFRKVVSVPDFVDEIFSTIKNTIANWINEYLNNAGEFLKKTCDGVKDENKKAYGAIGKSYITIIATFGQLSSDMKNKISDAYNKFIDIVKDFSEECKSYISSKWNVVSSWYEKTSSVFSDGVKNVWEKITDKVMSVVGSGKDAYKTLKDEANETWEDFLEWNDDKKQESIKAKLKYAIDTWGKDTITSWIKEF